MIYHSAPQGSDAWLASRKGCITGSRFKDARDRLADKPEKVCKKTGEVTPAQRGAPSAKCLRYAYDLARERCGGVAPGAFVTKAMQSGTEQEPEARRAYEALTGELVEEVGFITDDDAIFGVSVDGLVGTKGVIEIKTMVSSETLFTAMVFKDLSDYIDQINGAMWLLELDWIDLVLWAPDLAGEGLMVIHRIHRDEAEIEALETDLLAFAKMVQELTEKLKKLVPEKPKEEIMEIQKDIDPLQDESAPAPAAPKAHPDASELDAKTHCGMTDAQLAKLAFSKGWDFGKLKYCDYLYGADEAVVDAIYDLVVECREIGSLAFDAKYLSPPVFELTAPEPQDIIPTLRLGQINARLAPVQVTTDGLRSLGIEPAGTDRAAVLYHERDFSRICDALIAQVARAKLASK